MHIEEELRKLDSEIRRLKSATATGRRAAPPTTIKLRPVPVSKKLEPVKESAKRHSQLIRPPHLYAASIIVATSILYLLYGSGSLFVIYAFIGAFLWILSHKFHKRKTKTIYAYAAKGLIAVLLFGIYLTLANLFSLVIFALYTLSLVIASMTYLFHMKRGRREEIHASFPMTFMAVLYSHIIAFALASLGWFALMRLAAGDGYLTVLHIITVLIFPPIIIYFFLTRFLYLRFFDRVHILRELKKGAIHGSIYAVMFLACMVLVYLLSSMQLVISESAFNDRTLEKIIEDLPTVESDIRELQFEFQDTELYELKVTKDIIEEADALLEVATLEKKRLSNTPVLFSQYMDDRYVTVATKSRNEVHDIELKAAQIQMAKEDLIREYRRLKFQEEQKEFPGGWSTLEEYDEWLDTETVPGHTKSLKGRLEREVTLVDGYGSEDLFGENGVVARLGAGKDSILFSGESRFSKTLYDTIYRTKMARDLFVYGLTHRIKENERTFTTFIILRLYEKKDPFEHIRSRILRNRIIKSNEDAVVSVLSKQEEYNPYTER